MQDNWQTRRVFVTVKAYPNPSARYRETVCVAGITDDGKWIRLYPIPYRYLDYDQQFPTYSWITARIQKSSQDVRPESFKVDADSIELDGKVGTQNRWRERRQLVQPLLAPSLETLWQENRSKKVSLGLIRPRRVTRLIIRRAEAQWSDMELSKLQRTSLFDPQEQDGTYQAWKTLEKIPYQIKYHFFCDDDRCRGHNCRVISWEVMQSIRSWKSRYGDDWEGKFRQKYESQFLGDAVDLHFFMGTVHSHQYPNAWVIIGLFYPPTSPNLSAVQPPLF
jgi:hypothetical protein